MSQPHDGLDRKHLPIDTRRPEYRPTEDARDQRDPLPRRPLPTAPADAPNVLLILIDDMGFGASSSFGGPCRMPTADRLAGDGLRYSRFHTAAMCSPTRAALMTARNHHAVGMGTVVEISSGQPGYDATRPLSAGTLAQTLSGNGYATAAFGKWHQTPSWEQTPAGPFDRWPTREGFDHFYGFLGGEASQFDPILVEDTRFIGPPPSDDYHLSEDLVERTGDWIDDVGRHAPGKPWFCYLSFGATHAPFQVPESWRGHYRGEFAHGWDEQRERTLARQKQLGLVPPDADLAPWVDGVPHWDELTDTQRVAAERLMETYAAFAEHTDAQVGRVIQRLEESDELDNTIVIYILGDNGASAEGGLEGTLNETLRFNGIEDNAERIVDQLDLIGGPESYAHYPVGWALAMDTPYQWAKQVASHYGGSRNGMIVHWPAGIAARGEVRHQWHHVVDILPTLLEAAGIPAPETVNGVTQEPYDGVSMRYSFNEPDADERHHTQYFELFGNRGIYHEGWTAVAQHKTPWLLDQPLGPIAEDRWELYDTTTDWTQAHDIAAEHPGRLRELQERFRREAERNFVLPINDASVRLFNLAEGGGGVGGRPLPPTSLRLFPGNGFLREDSVPNVKNRSFRIQALVAADDEAVVPDGVIVAQGGGFAGWSLYVRDGRLTYAYNLARLELTHLRAERPIDGGEHLLEVRFAYGGGGPGQGGSLELMVDGDVVGGGRVERTLPSFFSMDQTLDVGIDRGTPVTRDYPRGEGFAWSGRTAGRSSLVEVLISTGEDAEPPTPDDLLKSVLVTH